MTHDLRAPKDSLLDLSLSGTGYKIPKGERSTIPIKNCTSMKSKISRKTIIAEHAEKMRHLPSSSTYKNTKHWNWSAKKNTWRPAGKFMTTKKISSTAEHMNRKKSIPGPNKYATTKIDVIKGRTLGTYKQKDIRWTQMDETIYVAKQTPGSNKYNPIEMEKIRSRSPMPHFNDRATSEIGARMKKLAKNDEPGCTSYST